MKVDYLVTPPKPGWGAGSATQRLAFDEENGPRHDSWHPPSKAWGNVGSEGRGFLISDFRIVLDQ